MSRIKEPSIEELQLRIDELEKSHNTYSEVIDTFTNGYVMDLISSNIKTIKIETLQNWFSNPDKYMENISNLLTYYYITNGDINNLYNMIFTLPRLDYKIVCYEKTDTYEKDMIKIKKALDKVGYKRLTRDLIVQEAHEGTCIATWLGNSNNPYLYIFEDLKYVFPYGRSKGNMIAVFDLDMMSKMEAVERKAIYENLKPLVTEKKYLAWKNATNKEIKDSLRYILLPGDKTFIGRVNTLYANQRLGVPMGTSTLFDLNHKEKLKELERAISDKVIRTFAKLSFKGVDDNGNKVSDAAKSKVFNAVKNALQKSVKGGNGSVSVLALPDFSELEFSSFEGVDTALDPNKYTAINDDITNSIGISRALTNGNGGNYATAKLSLEQLYRNIGVLLEDVEVVFNQLIKIVLGKKADNYKFEFDKEPPLSKSEKLSAMTTLVSQGYSVRYLTDMLNVDFEDFIRQSVYEIEELKLKERIIPPLNTNNISSDDNVAGRPSDDNSNNDNTIISKGNDGSKTPRANI